MAKDLLSSTYNYVILLVTLNYMKSIYQSPVICNILSQCLILNNDFNDTAMFEVFIPVFINPLPTECRTRNTVKTATLPKKGAAINEAPSNSAKTASCISLLYLKRYYTKKVSGICLCFNLYWIKPYIEAYITYKY